MKLIDAVPDSSDDGAGNGDGNDRGIDFGAVDQYGKTCLFYAENHILIQYLISVHEMDINARDNDEKR